MLLLQLERLKREKARRNLVDFVKYNFSDYDTNWHHKVLAEKLEAVERGEIRRLIVNMPPRAGKSTLVSTYFPAWYLGKNPDREVVVASYSADLAVGFGRSTRNLVRQNEYKNLFKVSLAEDSRSVGNWHTEKGGSYIAVGVGGALTGKGADLMIIDDPIKGREEANSDTVRTALWDWYRSTAYTRLSPIGAIVICQTRWTDDDLVGRLLEMGDEKADQWEIINFESIATQDSEYRKTGEALWPNRFPLERLEEIRANIGPYEWASLHQQDPVDVEHQEFKKQWFKHRPAEEVKGYGTRNFLTIDTAISEKASGDFTGWVENYVDQEGNWNIAAKRFRVSPGFLINMLFDSFREHQWEKIGIEKTIYLQSIKQFMDDEMRKRGVYLPIVELEHRQQAKEVRIRGLIPRYERGGVYHIEGACEDLEGELVRFPKAKWDDLSDSLAYQMQIAERPFPQDTVTRYDMMQNKVERFTNEML